jgi:holliday junction DNA helicase RuvA
MLEYIKGTLIKVEPNKAIVEANGIAYKLLIPISSYSSDIVTTKDVLFYTSLVVREDSHTLYGFLQEMERDLFEMLITVTGIGPKIALTIIGHLTLENLHLAIVNDDCRLISKVPGIGKKTAAKLIIEMRDKLKKLDGFMDATMIPNQNEGNTQEVSDAIHALIHLGYNPIQAQKAIKKAVEEDTSSTTASLISFALSQLQR